MTAGTIRSRQSEENPGRRFVTAGKDIGRMIAMSFHIDIHGHGRVVARGQRIALPDIALRCPVADHRNAKGKRHTAVLPDPGSRPQEVFIIKKMRRVIEGTMNEGDTRTIAGQTLDNPGQGIIAQPRKPAFGLQEPCSTRQ